MVNTGKPSSGCGTCRARRIKCDDRRPTCFQCQKSKRECQGYRKQDHLNANTVWTRNTKIPQIKASNDVLAGAPSSVDIKGPSQQIKSRNKLLLSSGSELSPAIEDQAICIFIKSYVATPDDWGNQGVWSSVTPAVSGANNSLSQTNTVSFAAMMAVSYGVLASKTQHKLLRAKAIKQYTLALKQVNEALQDSELALGDQTLATVLTLMLFENIYGSNDRAPGWSSHVNGAAMLVQLRKERKAPMTPYGEFLHSIVRSQLAVNCFLSSTGPPIGVDWWMDFKSEDFELPNALHLSTAAIHVEIKKQLAIADRQNVGDLKKVLRLNEKAKEMEERFQAWEASKSAEWDYHTVDYIDEIDVQNLESAEAYPGRIDKYLHRTIACLWNMMRAARLVLAADILRISSWISEVTSPRQEHRSLPEYTGSRRLSQRLIEDVIASVPLFLGYTVSDSPDADLVGVKPGESAIASLVVWPLYVVKISEFTTESQRRWVIGRLQFVGHERGFGNALDFAKSNARLPFL